MGLDVYILEAGESKPSGECWGSLELIEHGALIRIVSSHQEQFPMFMRLRSYFQDAIFQHSELEALIHETERLVSVVGTGKTVGWKFRQGLHGASCTAFCSEKRIGVFCD